MVETRGVPPAPAHRSTWARVRDGVEGLPPAYFALVMATGIVSTAARELGLPAVSLALFVIAVACYAVLCVLTVWRLVAYPRRVAADAAASGHAFTFFTFTAASDVLALRFAAAGQDGIATGLAVLGGASWLLLTYAIPMVLIAGSGRRAAAAPPASVDGTWLLWVVGTQSVAGAAATLAAVYLPAAGALAFVAVVLWWIAVVLYLLLMATISGRLLLGQVSAPHLTHPYWITMGATAISVLSAARILRMPGPLPPGSATLSAIAFALWAFGSWWIPLLLLLGAWRHAVRRVPLVYEPGLWAMVFPLGMYAAASQIFGQVAGFPELEAAARVDIWIALLAWAATFASFAFTLARALRPR